jgi:hypothetical protein
LTTANNVKSSAPLSMAGGTLNVSGTNQTLNTLTLTGGVASTIDFGANNVSSHLTLGDSHALAANWSTGSTLGIADWSGSATGGGADTLLFGNGSGLTLDQVNAITFLNPTVNGSQWTGSFGAQLLSSGELVPIPEPSGLVALLGGCSVLAGLQRFRRRQLPKSPICQSGIGPF